MSDRPLATIQKIDALNPIEGADRIEVANIAGWHVVVKKGEFQVGDFCAYVEIDSILPTWPEFDFMAERKYKVKTIKLRKQVSQGICFPLDSISVLKKKFAKGIGYYWEIGEDVTELLQIKKNEPDVNNQSPVFNKKDRTFYARKIKPILYDWAYGIRRNPSLGRPFPSFIPKTDETRVQWMAPILREYAGEAFYVTEKLDGSSMTIYVKNGYFGVCSRNLEQLEYTRKEYKGFRKVWANFIAKTFKLKEPGYSKDNHFLRTAEKLNIKDTMMKMRDLAIQGEILGPDIQKNKYKLTDFDFYVFNIFDIDTKRYLNLDAMKEVCNTLKLKMVPVVNDNFILNHSIDELVELSKGNSVLYKRKREGIVLRPVDDCNGKHECSMISFKAINSDFLLENNE